MACGSQNPPVSEFSCEFPDSPKIHDSAQTAEPAIDHETLAQTFTRIPEGSGGSYFAKNKDNKTIAIFKPKDEEPHGHLNTKWTNWVMRNTFGRGCLLPNQEYLSEAGASLVDEKLGLGIVPKTEIVRFASESFNYTAIERANTRTKKYIPEHSPTPSHNIGLPPKIGSFQMFVDGYTVAKLWLGKFGSKPLPANTEKSFQIEFEKLVCLDYIIRNTDRSNENWLIKEDFEDRAADKGYSIVKHVSASVAAINNGLAFPFKHPDDWRMYPYHWLWLPQACKTFSKEIKDLVLPKISEANFIDNLIQELHGLFSQNEKFEKGMFERQMSVMRGQIWNLSKALKENKNPEQLVQMIPVTLEKTPDLSVGGGIRSMKDNFAMRYHNTKPYFTNW